MQTPTVRNILSKVVIESVMVSKNITHLLQLLDLSTNASLKKYDKQVFSEYFSASVMVTLKNNPECDVTTIKVDLCLSALKPYVRWD